MALQTNLISAYREANLFKVEPTYPLPHPFPTAHLDVIQGIVDEIIPESIAAEFLNAGNADLGSIYYRFTKLLPLVKYPSVPSPVCAIPIAVLVPAEYTHGTGRYIADTLSRWLIPGKPVTIAGRVSLNFRFVAYPSMTFYLTQELIASDSPEDQLIMMKNLPSLAEEMKINIMAVYHARHIASLRSSSHHNKNLIFQENISSVLNKNEDVDPNSYDQIPNYLQKLSDEEKINQIKRNISYLLNSRPKIFDRLVYEIAQYSSLFGVPHSFKRNPRHLSRVIAYQYLFKKILLENMRTAPLERHLSIKIFRNSPNQREPILAVLLGFNFLNENERFEIKHLMEAIRSCVPRAAAIPDSIVVNRRHEKMRFFYLELSKEGVTQGEIKSLKEKISQEILRQIEHVMHPVFMPRNDEDLIRNLIVLSKQIKYVRDLPQVSIHYDMQSESELTFTVVLVRILKDPSESLHRLLQESSKSLKFDIDDVRIAGYLKNKYPKEAAILRTTLQKNAFFRPDFSVDLLRARQRIVLELTKILGEFRDFNGGIILKQEESLSQLRDCIGPLTEKKGLLLENYFYSLRPGIMQTVYDSATLKIHFELMMKAIAFPLNSLTHQVFNYRDEKYYLCFIKAIAASFKEPIMDAIGVLQIPSYDLSTTFIQVEQAALLGMILRIENRENIALFESKIGEAVKTWSENFACPLP